MNRRKIAIVVLSAAVISLLLAVFRSPRRESVPGGPEGSVAAALPSSMVEEMGREQMTENYKSSLVPLLSGYRDLFRSAASGTAATSSAGLMAAAERIKDEAMSLTVPEEFRDLHLLIVLSLDSLAKYLDSGRSADLEESLRLFGKAEEASAKL